MTLRDAGSVIKLLINYTAYHAQIQDTKLLVMPNEKFKKNFTSSHQTRKSSCVNARGTPRSKYTLCCSGRGYPSPPLILGSDLDGRGYPPAWTWEGGTPPPGPGKGVHPPPPPRVDGVPPPWSRCELTHKPKILPSPILRMRAVTICGFGLLFAIQGCSEKMGKKHS